MSFRFDPGTPPAKRLVQEVLKKLQEIWDAELTDDAIALYSVALCARGTDHKKLLNQLSSVLPEQAITEQLVEWWVVLISRAVTALAWPGPPALHSAPGFA